MDSQTFAQWYDGWRPALEREAAHWLPPACRDEAPDVVSESYLALQPYVPTLRPVHAAVFRYCEQRVRWRSKERRRPQMTARRQRMCSLDAAHAIPTPDVEALVIEAEAAQAVAAAAAAACTTPQQRQILYLLLSGLNNHYHYGDRSALADLLGISDQSLKQRVHHVRKRIRAALPQVAPPPRRHPAHHPAHHTA